MMNTDSNGVNRADAVEVPQADILGCQICGRQDETIRAVVYPYVVSLLVVTQRRAFSGVWCRVHRWQRLVLASLITGTLGWLGIPFGFLYTPLALFKLARGGDQPKDLNVRLLKDVAERRMAAADTQGAMRCLEAILQLDDSPAIRDQLEALYKEHGAPPETGFGKQVLLMLGAILTAILVGSVIGVLDMVRAIGLAQLAGAGVSIYVVVLGWALIVALVFVGGLALSQIVEWGLQRIQCSQLLSGFGLAIPCAALGWYGLLGGRAMAQYVWMLLTGWAFESASETLQTVGALLTRGGAWAGLDLVEAGSGGIINVLIWLAAAVYFAAMSVSAAVRTVRWQLRLVPARQEEGARLGRAFPAVWVAALLVILGSAALIGFFPQRGLVDYVEAVAHVQHAQMLSEQGRLSDMVVELEQAVRHEPGWAEARLGLAGAYIRQDKPVQASEQLQEVIRLNPASAVAHNLLGWIYYQQDEMEQAAAEFEEAVRLDPNLAEAFTGLGWIRLFGSEEDKARAAFQQAISLDPLDGDAYGGLGLVYVARREYKLAVDALVQAVQLSPENTMLYYGLGTAYLNENEIDKAIENLQKATESHPDFHEARLGLAMARLSRADFAQAAEDLRIVIAAEPDWCAAHAARAEALYMLDQLDLGDEELQQAQACAASDPAALLALAATYTVVNRFAEGEECLLQALALSPGEPSIYVNLAGVYSNRSQFKLALEMCDKALEVDKEYVGAYWARSSIYVDMEDLDRALQELVKGQELAPLDGDGHSLLSYIYRQQGRIDESLQEAKEAVRRSPYAANGHKNLAFAYHGLGQLDLALPEAEQAVKLSPRYDEAHYILGLCYLDKGEVEKACTELQKFLELYVDRAYVRDYKSRAEAYLAQLKQQ
jgi:tetratricopeptide (TPR) repeat protein